MRPPIIIKNHDKAGKVFDGWYVRVGTASRVFNQSDWESGGIEWINAQIVAAGRASTARVEQQKDRRPQVNRKPSAQPVSKTSNAD